MQKYDGVLEQSGHKSSVGVRTVLVCTIAGACVGAIPTWNAGDDCMIPYGIIPFVAGIVCGAIGLVVGLMAAPIAMYVEKERRESALWRRGSGDTGGPANLLRPSSQHHAESLLQPASTTGADGSNSLLRSSESEGISTDEP